MYHALHHQRRDQPLHVGQRGVDGGIGVDAVVVAEQHVQIGGGVLPVAGIVAGPRGAATRLGMKRTTLLSRMQRLGISVREVL